MLPPYEPYIPRGPGEINDKLAWMVMHSPTFEDDTGFFPGQNLETTFFSLNEGFKAIRNRLGTERYAALLALSDRARAHFEADPEDNNGGAGAGCALLNDMTDILRSLHRRKPVAANDTGEPASVPPKNA